MPFGWVAREDLVLKEIHSIHPCRVIEINPHNVDIRRRLWPSSSPTIHEGFRVETSFLDGGAGPEPILVLDKP